MHQRKQEIQLHLKDKGMFEGWYFRVSDRKVSLAVIVGVSETMAFIQTIDTYTNVSQMLEFDLNEFEYGNAPDIERYIQADPENAEYEYWLSIRNEKE